MNKYIFKFSVFFEFRCFKFIKVISISETPQYLVYITIIYRVGQRLMMTAIFRCERVKVFNTAIIHLNLGNLLLNLRSANFQYPLGNHTPPGSTYFDINKKAPNMHSRLTFIAHLPLSYIIKKFFTVYNLNWELSDKC